MTPSQLGTPRKVFLGTASHRQMYSLFNRHHQAPFDDDRMSGRLYAGEWFRIEQAGFHEMQEVLPPRYVAADAFALSEYLAGSVTSIFYELRGESETRFYHAYCDLGDKTSITAMREAMSPSLTREEALEHIWSMTDDDFRGYADGDSRLRTILVYEPALGTTLKRLRDLTTSEIAETPSTPASRRSTTRSGTRAARSASSMSSRRRRRRKSSRSSRTPSHPGSGPIPSARTVWPAYIVTTSTPRSCAASTAATFSSPERPAPSCCAITRSARSGASSAQAPPTSPMPSAPERPSRSRPRSWSSAASA